MRYPSIIKAGILFLFSTLVYADGIFSETTEFPLVWGKVITLSGGPVWGTGGRTQSLYLFPFPDPYPDPEPYQYNTYYANRKTSTMGSGEIVFSLQRTLNPCLIGQIGIGIAGAGEAKLQGVAWIDENPLNLYTYSYRLNHARVTLKGKLLGGTAQWYVNPYISGSFGVGYNHSYHFEIIPVSPLLPLLRGFESNTQSLAFAYTLGAGISRAFSSNWRAGIGYEFADWGKSNLGPLPQSSVLRPDLETGLRLTNFYTHELLFSLSYIY